MSDRHVQPLRSTIDGRRQLRPSDYACDPHGFGERHDVVFRVPAGGDDISCEISELIHEFVVAIRHQPGAASGAELGRRFGFSRQTWSSVTRGQRWPGHTVLAAMWVALRDTHTQRHQPLRP